MVSSGQSCLLGFGWDPINFRTRAGSVALAFWMEKPHSSQKEGLNGAPGRVVALSL